MRKHLLTLICALCALSFIPSSLMATDYAPMGDLPASPSQSSTLPIYTGSGTFTSITQQLYYASEMTAAGASAGDITALKFYFGNKTMTVREVTRNLEIFIKLVPTSFTEFEVGFTNTDKYTYKFTDPGTASTNKVFDGSYTIPATYNNGDIIERTINTSRFYWDGTSNILVTVIDKTNKKFYSLSGEDYSDSNLKSYGKVPAVTASRFVHQYWTLESSSEFTTYKNSLDGKFGFCSKNSTVEATERTAHSYVNIVKFTIEPHEAPVAPSAPEDLAATPSANSASLSWSAVDGATSYDLYNSTSIDGVYSKFASSATNSYDWSVLTANTTYYVKVAAVNGAGSSALSDPISFTTLAPHIHDGITFEPWSNPSALPTSGNYYLNTDVELASDWNVTENINLCLNGHEVYTETNSIQVKDGATFAIYDNEGGGRIYGYFVADYPKYGLINIENGGTLVLSEGTIQNLYGSYEEDDDPDDKSLSNAIYNNGMLKLSGALTFTSYHADIYLGSNKYITIESEKPLTNSEPYSVYKSGKSVITSGWANMNGADPKDYFVSANTSLNIKMGETEAEFYPVISLSENNTNTAIGTYSGQMVDVNLTRSLTSLQYNTFCLPFALDDDQLQEFFGTGYDLEEFVSSSLEGDVLKLVFNNVTSLEAGKPYLLQPSVDVANPSFEGVTIAATEPVDQTSDANISFHATFAPTELEGGNKNLLFLGAENELFYPASTANIKAFRAYFELKGAAVNSAPKARIVKKQDSATGVENQMVNGKCGNHKFLKDGQLYILREGKMYNVLGMEK